MLQGIFLRMVHVQGAELKLKGHDRSGKVSVRKGKARINSLVAWPAKIPRAHVNLEWVGC